MKKIYFICCLLLININLLLAQTIDVTNVTHTGAVYEACPGDVVNIDYQNLSATADYFYIERSDGLKNLVLLTIARGGVAAITTGPGVLPGNVNLPGQDISITPLAHPLGGGCVTVCAQIPFTVPTNMVTSTITFYDKQGTNSVALGTIVLSVVNPYVSVGALAPITCSEDTIPLVTSPDGGTFSIQDITSATFLTTNATPGATGHIQMPFGIFNPVFTDAVFVPNDPTSLTNNLEDRNIRVHYNYTPVLTTTTANCPVKTVTQETLIKNNSLSSVLFATASDQSSSNPITILTTSDGIFQSLIGTGTVGVSYSGTYVSGTTFDGTSSGPGFYPLIMTINNGGCETDIDATINVSNAPPSGLPSTLCTLDPAIDIWRDSINFDWSPFWQGSGFIGQQYMRYNMVVSCVPAACLVPVNLTLGSEHYQLNPALAPGGTTSITLTISYQTQYRSCLFGSCSGSSGWFNSVSYVEVIGLTDPPFPVIDSTLLPTYCESTTFVPLNSTPAGGAYTLWTISGPNAGASQALVGSFNPSTIHAGDNFDTRYRLIYEVGSGGCTGRDTAEFDILEPLVTAFIGRHSSNQGNTDNRYCINGGIDILSPSPLPVAYGHPDSISYSQGGFSGPGIIGYGPQFDPILAGVGVHTIRYTYVSQFGCKSFIDSLFTVNPKPSISLTSTNPGNDYCANDSVGYLIGSPYGGLYYGPTISNVSDTIFEPNTVYASSGLSGVPGYANYSYTFTSPTTNCKDTVSVIVTINPIPQPYFTIPPYFCESDPPELILGIPGLTTTYETFYTTAGDTLGASIVIDSVAPFLSAYYNPNPNYPNTLYATTHRDTIIYEVADLTPCVGRDTQYVTVFPNPVHNFVGINGALDTTDQACLGRDTITLHSSLVNGFTYFQGPGILFGTNRFVADVSGVGPHVLTSYFVDTSNLYIACRDTFVDTFFVHSTPNVEFAVDGGCGGVDIVFEPNNTILGLNRYFFGTTNLYDSITTAVWDFGDGNINSANYSIGPIQNAIDTAHHLYLTPGVYTTSLFVENRGFCSDSDTVRVIVLPTRMATDSIPYYEDFQASDGGWIEEAEIGNQSSNLWYWSVAGGIRIKTTNDPNHDKVWITHPNTPYGQNESGWVYSPCFDISNLDRPMIKLDYFSDTDPGNDGVVIEYFNYTFNKWLPLGNVGEGINWYNQSVIAGRPGVQDLAPKGWSGAFGAWRDARYALDNINSYTELRLRVAFGAVGVSQGGYEGFAFDKVWIGNRTRNVLLEHFTNYGLVNFDASNSYVYNLIYGTSLVKDVILAEYHTELPGPDQFNNDNRQDPSARILSYGIDMTNTPSTAKAVINGKGFGAGAPASINLVKSNFEYDMLESPKFDIQIDTFIVNLTSVQVRTTITANENLAAEDYIVRILILEDSMAYFTGENVHSVVRKMLPNAAGTFYNSSWTLGHSETITESWSFSNTIYDPNKFTVVVFIQRSDDMDKAVLQAASSRDITSYAAVLGSPEAEVLKESNEIANSMVLFPNPAHDVVNIRFDDPLPSDYRWQVIDLRGAILQEGDALEGIREFSLRSYDWASGMYLLILRNDKFSTQRKIVILND